MDPQQQAPPRQRRRQRRDMVTPKWRHFGTQTRVMVQNILDHDVVFEVADDDDIPYSYVMPKGKVSELPGGLIATLGVKALVDQLIANEGEMLRMYDQGLRAEKEELIIQQVVDIKLKRKEGPNGVTDLSSGNGDVDIDDEEQLDTEEQPFGGDSPRRSNRPPRSRNKGDDRPNVTTAIDRGDADDSQIIDES